MIDSTRPVAPFLPPEIISKVLQFFHPEHKDWSIVAKNNQEFSPLVNISREWRVEGTKRLFEGIEITTSKELSEFVNSLEYGAGDFMQSLDIFLDQEESTMVNVHHLFQILLLAPNLKHFGLHLEAAIYLSPEEGRHLRSSLLLPKMITLKLWSDCDAKEWNRSLFDPLIAISYNTLVNLSLRARNKYEGPKWTPVTFPALEKLSVVYGGVLEGNIWGVSSFAGLKALKFMFPESMRNLSKSELPFFKVVGPTLIEFISTRITIPISFYPLLTVLDRVSVICTDRSNKNIPLPPSITLLSFQCYEKDPFPVPFLTLPNLQFLSFSHSYEPCDLSLLLALKAPLKVLSISTMTQAHLIESLENLVIGNIPFDQLRLGKDLQQNYNEILDEGNRDQEAELAVLPRLSEDEEVKTRCKELGIDMIGYGVILDDIGKSQI